VVSRKKNGTALNLIESSLYKYHQSCDLLFSNSKLNRAQKRESSASHGAASYRWISKSK